MLLKVQTVTGLAMSLLASPALAQDRAAPMAFAFEGGKYELARQTTDAANKVAGWMFGWHVSRTDAPLPASSDEQEVLAVKVVEDWLATKPTGFDCAKQGGTFMHGGIAKPDGTVVVTYQCNEEK
jgi:hypothetical protein